MLLAEKINYYGRTESSGRKIVGLIQYSRVYRGKSTHTIKKKRRNDKELTGI